MRHRGQIRAAAQLQADDRDSLVYTSRGNETHEKRTKVEGGGRAGTKTFFILGRQNTPFTPERICLFAVVLIH